jgi:CBS domain-containing protein
MVEIVKRFGPIAAEELASRLNLSRAAIRSDLSVLSMMGYLEARPRVGYTYAGKEAQGMGIEQFRKTRVRDVQSVPVVIREDKSLYEAVVSTFLDDTGTLFVVDNTGYLVGAVSRGDLLRSAIGQVDLEKVPVGVIMTRVSNLITLSPEDGILSAARKLWIHKISALPVVREAGKNRLEVTGVITLESVTGLFAELGETH